MDWGRQQRAEGVDPASKFFKIPIRSNICGMCQNKSDPWSLHPPQQKDPLQLSLCQTPHKAPRGFMTMLWQVIAVLAEQGEPAQY